MDRRRGPDRRNLVRSLERRKVGRPPLVAGQRADDVTIRLTNDLHDEAILRARYSPQYNNNVSAVIRDALSYFFRTVPADIVCPVNTQIDQDPTK